MEILLPLTFSLLLLFATSLLEAEETTASTSLLLLSSKREARNGTCSKDEEDCWYPERYEVLRSHSRVLRLLADAYFGVVNAVFQERNEQKSADHVSLEGASQLLYIPATKAAAMIREGKLNSTDLVRAYTDRITAVNGMLHAVFTPNFDAAISMAESVDKKLAGMSPAERKDLAKTMPLYGVPFTSKQNIKNKGFVIGACNWQLLNSSKPCTEDAEIVARVKKAGAILLGITAMPNTGLSWACDDSACGQVNNPHDIRRIPGGSSSGEGSIIAAAGSLFGIGNDIGGSVRIPAHMCGVFGLKPTNFPNHTVPVEGIVPDFVAYKPAADMLTNGPLARYAEDFPLILSIMADRPLADFDIQVDFAKGFRFFYLEDLHILISEQLYPEQRNAVHKVKDYFEHQYNVTAQKVDFPLMDRLFELWGLTGWSDGVMTIPQLAMEFWDVFTSESGTLPHTLMSWEFDVLKYLVYPRDAEEKKFVAAKLDKLRRELAELLGKDGVLLLPAWPTPPPFHHMEPFTGFNLLYTQMFNVLGNPAMTVPTGKSSLTNMPTGVQIAGAPHNEALLIAVGRELERAFGGWVKPGSKE